MPASREVDLADKLKAVDCRAARPPLNLFRTIARLHRAERIERGGGHPFRLGEFGRALGLDQADINFESDYAEKNAEQSRRAAIGHTTTGGPERGFVVVAERARGRTILV